MSYDDEAYRAYKKEAMRAIEQGNMEAYKMVLTAAVYEDKKPRTIYVTPEPPPGTYWTYDLGIPDDVPETVYDDVVLPYLRNREDKVDFLNAALEHKQQQFIDLLFEEGLRFSHNQFKIYAAQKGCPEEVFNAIEPVFRHLVILSQKAAELVDRGYSHDAKFADNLVLTIRSDIKRYIEQSAIDDPKKALGSFKEECIKHTAKANTVLNEHRGCKSAIANFLITVCSLTIANIVNLIVTKGEHGFFDFETDSGRKVNDFRETACTLSYGG